MKSSLIVLIACLLFAGVALAEEFTRTETLEFSLSEGDEVEIYNINGDATLEEWDLSNIEITYIISCEDEESLDHIMVEFDTSSGLECSVEYDDQWDAFDNSNVDFILSIPADKQLDYQIAFVNGDVVLVGGDGSARLELVNGDITVEDFDGELSTSLVNGDIVLTGSDGLRVVELVNGTVNCSIASIQGDVELDAVSGNVLLELGTPARVIVETISGEISVSDAYDAIIEENYVGRSSEFGQGDYVVEINTVSGNVSVTD
jgi:DUF4097 and DUF4098 domain-containing protein YvlB